MPPRLLLVPFALATLAFAACSPPVACTEEARSSVSVDLADADGAPVADATLRYSVDGGAEQPCEELGGAWVCGWEEAGAFVLIAEAPGFGPQQVEVQVDEDECHVITEVVQIRLEAASAAFDEAVGLQHVVYEGTDCDDALAQGENCSLWVLFCPDGSAEMLVTDILNDGTYTQATDGDVTTIEAAFPMGDAPATIAFTWDADGITDDAWGYDWVLDPDASCE